MLHVYAGPTSYLTRSAYDEDGRQVLAWATSHSESRTSRGVQRWTYVCGSPNLARHEEDRDGDGTVDRVKTWTWDPAARTVTEREGTEAPGTVYRFDCSP
jgi:hypothetical protein